MSDSGPNREPSRAPAGNFAHTQWSLVLAAGERSTAESEEALAAFGKVALFNHLKVFLTGAESHVPYREVAAALGMSEGAVKVAVHRLRQRFRTLLRAEIAQTIDRPDDPGAIDDEIRYLLAVLGS